MTQPDGQFPESAFNWDSIAELAAKTEQDVEDELYGRTEAPFLAVLAGLFAGLPTGMPLPLAILTVLARELLGLPGHVWNNMTELLADIQPWVAEIPGLGDVVEAITGIEDGDLGDLGTFFLNVRAFLASINFNAPGFDPAVAVAQFVNLMLLPLNLLLGPNSPLNPANILGRLRINQIGGVSLSHVITQTSNLFAEFINADSVPSADGWSFDAVNSAAQVVLDGTTKAIYDDPIDVAPGQEIAGSIEALLDSVTSTPGSAVELALLLYDGVSESPTGTYVFDSIADPSGTVTWAELSGTYTVPASGVKAVAPELRVEGGTAGTVKFKTPAGEIVLPSVLQDGLPKAIQDRIDDMQATWDKFKGGVGGTVDDIEDALDDAGQAIRDAIANALGHAGTGHTSANILTYLQNIPQTVVQNLEDDFANADDAIADVFDDVRDGWNRFWDGTFRTSGSTGKTATDVQTAAESISTAIVVAQDSAITLANLANAPKNVPFWVSPNPFEDVSFPRSQIVPRPSYIFPANTGSASGAGSHFHPLSSPTPASSDQVQNIASGRLLLTAIRTTQNRVYNQVGFVTDGDTPPATVYVGLFRIDPLTGDYSMEYDFGNVSSQIATGSGLVDQRFTTDRDIASSEGDLWAVGVLPIGGALGTAQLYSSVLNLSGVYPSRATGVLTGQSSLPVSVTDAELIGGGYRMWACLGQLLPQEEVTSVAVTDTFNVGNTTQWSSSSWYVTGSGPYNLQVRVGVTDGSLRMVRYETLPSPADMHRRVGIYKTPLGTNSQAAEITVGRVPDISSAPAQAIVRARNNATQGAALEITSGQARIVTFDAAADPTPTVRASASTTVNVGDQFRIEAEGEVYTAYRNDVPISGCEWTDTGNSVIPLTAPFKSAGWLISFDAGTFVEQHSAWITNWAAYDL
ncbi:hypothetical protein [Mycobacterium sp. CnD-18-1]|uniref:hypothetical protein n=1 Tax=Mycobacterium sp. CnD-18-1 TaxID=2917744 RepID=UPI001EF18C65|nr:hypothetical protein [Mycobacterium sp. CnD-18-1]MCG7610332.1 hypothetical protein [Mycobacterium sp. CnD-18-1]